MTRLTNVVDPMDGECLSAEPNWAIQPHGCLLICDAGLNTIRGYSRNVSAMLGLSAAALDGGHLRDLLGKRVLHELRNAMARSNAPGRPGVVFGLPLGAAGEIWDVAVHAGSDGTIIEFLPAVEDCPSPLEMVRGLVGRLNGTGDEKQAFDMAVRLVRSLLRYDRVMACGFQRDASGEIVAEAKRGDLPAWRGLRFPIGEMPGDAASASHAARIIGDTRAAMVPIMPPIHESGTPPDLSFAFLRGVSPRYSHRLLGMDVLAAVSIPIMRDGGLAGFITCHHYERRHLSVAKSVAAQMFGEYLSLHLDAVRRRIRAAAMGKARGCLDRLLKDISLHPSLTAQLKEKIRNLQKLIPCDGVGFWIEGIWASDGSAAPAKSIPALARFVNGVAQGQVWATHRLSDEFPAASEFAATASGLIAIPLSQLPRDYLFFFRKEHARTVAWTAPFDEMQCDGKYARGGAARWEEILERQSSPWSETDLDIAAAMRTTMLEIVIRHNEMAVAEWRQSELHQKTLNEELNHRVKNILALIKSLVSRPVETSRGIQDYVMALSGRVQALAHAHDQAVGSGGGALRDLLNIELSPYRDPPDRITLDGPEIDLDPAAFSAVALVIHELATNAVKYGALSAKDGALAVRWRALGSQALGSRGGCEIVWSETGGPPLTPPAHQGFGSALITRSIPFNLGGESEIEFAPTGVRARLLIPEAHILPEAHIVPRSSGQSAAAFDTTAHSLTDPEAGAKPLDGRRVLLVEDQLIIAMDVESMLLDLGASTVDSAAGAAEALRKLSLAAPDVAVLDINLGSGTSLTVAEELTRRGIPYVFATGYGETQLAGRMGSVPVVRKPYEVNALAAALGRCLSPPE